MAEKKSWLGTLATVVGTFAGIVITAVGVYVAIETGKRELSFQYLSFERVVSLDSRGRVPELKLEYQSRPISSLVKQRFVLRNTGSTAIKREDVREKIRFIYPENTNLLTAFVEATKPSTFAVSLDLGHPKAVGIDFDLLNPGEEIYISTYIFDSDPVAPRIDGRIVELKQLIVEPNPSPPPTVLSFIKNQALRKAILWLAIILLFFVGGLFALVPISGWIELLRSLRWKYRFAEFYNSLRQSNTSLPPLNLNATFKGLRSWMEPVSKDQKLRERLEAENLHKLSPTALFDTWRDAFLMTAVFSALAALFLLAGVALYGVRPIG